MDECVAARAGFNRCFHQYISERDVLENCIPLSPVERITGTWGSGFEFNNFAENEVLNIDDMFVDRGQFVGLVIEGTQIENMNIGVLMVTVELRFDGRRPLCGIVPDWSAILVDRVYSYRIIDQPPSNWR